MRAIVRLTWRTVHQNRRRKQTKNQARRRWRREPTIVHASRAPSATCSPAAAKQLLPSEEGRAWEAGIAVGLALPVAHLRGHMVAAVAAVVVVAVVAAAAAGVRFQAFQMTGDKP